MSVGIWRDMPPLERRRTAETWLITFNGAMERRDCALVASMMDADGYWRDLLTFGWGFKTLHGIDEIQAWSSEAFEANPGRSFQMEGEPGIGAIGEHRETLEFFFTFEN